MSNYAVVHAYGQPDVTRDTEWIRRHVAELTAQQERNEIKPWALTDAPGAFIEAMSRNIIGFRFGITRLDGSYHFHEAQVSDPTRGSESLRGVYWLHVDANAQKLEGALLN
jgi:transcriptional regulator